MTAEKPLKSGTQIDNFVIQSIFQKGSFGEIYSAQSMPGNEPVLIRFLPVKINDNVAALDQLTTDVETYAALSHPHLAKVLAFQQHADSGRWYIAMELGEGKPLAEWVKNPDLSPPEAIMIMKGALEAMQFVHANKLLHGDLNTLSVVVSEDNSVKITNFAFEDDSWSDCDAREFRAPELGSGNTPSSLSTDMYALGITFRKLIESIGVARIPVNIRRTTERMWTTDPRVRNKSMAEVIKFLSMTNSGSSKADAEDLLAQGLKRSFADQEQVTGSIMLEQKTRYIPTSIVSWITILALAFGGAYVYKRAKANKKGIAVALKETGNKATILAKKVSGIERAEQAKKSALEMKADVEASIVRHTAVADAASEGELTGVPDPKKSKNETPQP